MMDGVSILVVCYSRIALLRRLFESILVADKDMPWEVVVVDNSKTNDARAIESMCSEFGYRYYYARESVAIKRNLAARYARYDLLYYCDSDCVLDKRAVMAHWASYEGDRIGAACGPITLEGENTRFFRTIRGSPWMIAFSLPNEVDTVPWGPTANFSIRKTVLEEIGGFDESFPNKPGGEDVDIGVRLNESGYTIASARQAVVYHSNKTWDNPRDVIGRLYNYGRADAKLITKYPNKTMTMINKVSVHILLMLLGAILSLVMADPICILVAFLAMISDFTLSVLIETMVRFHRISGLSELTIALLSYVEEIGCVVQCIRWRRVSPIFKQFLYSEYQYRSVFERALCNSASFMIVLVMFLSLTFCLL